MILAFVQEEEYMMRNSLKLSTLGDCLLKVFESLERYVAMK